MIARRKDGIFAALIVMTVLYSTPSVRGQSVGMRGVVRRLCNDVDCLVRHKKPKPPPPAPTRNPTEAPTAKPTEAPVVQDVPTDEAQDEGTLGEEEPDTTEVTNEVPTNEEQSPVAEEQENTTSGENGETAAATEDEGDTENAEATEDNQESSIPFETEGSVEEDTGKVSTCKIAPINPPPISTTVSYTYEVKMTAGAVVQEILAAIEEEVHNVLTNQLLNCDFSGGSTRKMQAGVEYTSVSSLPKDSPVTTGNVVCADDEDCYKISGGITSKHMPWDLESDIVDQVRSILTESEVAILSAASPDLRVMDFTSFSTNTDETTSDVTDTADRDPAVGSAVFNDESSGPSKGAIAGGVTVAVVALCVAVAALLVSRRVRERRNTAVPAGKSAAQDRTILLDDGSTSSSSDGFKAVIIHDNDSLSPHNTTTNTDIETSLNELENSHDPDSCTSDFCKVCEELNLSKERPEFVSIPNGGMSNDSSTPPSISESVSERTYAVSDTISL